MRKFASIQKVKKLEPIPGKDRIELATILGWTVIVQKGQFNIDDLCIYIEVDSLLPEKPEFEFLRSRCWSKKWQGFRIRAMKMGEVISYGIVFPLSILPTNCWVVPGECLVKDYIEGGDVTEILEIKKYNPEELMEKANVKQRKSKNPIIRFLFKFKLFRNIFLKNHIKLTFPSHLVSKTDETRLQAIPFVVDDFKNTVCYVSEKLDGCSATYVYNKRKFMVCSRNIEVVNKNSKYWKIAEKYDLKEKLKGLDVAVQGEIIGHSQNGSGKNIYMSELDFYVFNIINTKTRKNLSLSDIKTFCKVYKLKMVPILKTNYILGTHTVEKLIEKAKGMSCLYNVEREGIVIRDLENKYQPIRGVGDSLSFKVINPDYLIKHHK